MEQIFSDQLKKSADVENSCILPAIEQFWDTGLVVLHIYVYCSSKEHIPKDSPLKDIVNTGYALEQLRQVKFSQFLTFALLTKVVIL